MINRRLVRETVLQSIYAHQQSGDTVQYITDTIIKEKVGKEKEARRFAEKLFFRTLDNESQFNEIIESHIKNWDINRLAMIDLIVLKMALCEFIYFEEIPTKVTINEAIEIVKKYSTAKSGKFVNGILDASLLELSKQGKINKKGRGLIERSTGK
ncbi:MAG: transcription antitermination factor NusB [Balneolaceae bacterium]|nr:transcription antitermination factor NusB [Balneolaceae bacterium]MBO6546395.1 transcription antitermination factor NusB [Balneolaceae bacterium]MBO6648754.1 transcription antitermination factor NusB [Balneolaceae bacterium]